MRQSHTVSFYFSPSRLIRDLLCYCIWCMCTHASVNLFSKIPHRISGELPWRWRCTQSHNHIRTRYNNWFKVVSCEYVKLRHESMSHRNHNIDNLALFFPTPSSNAAYRQWRWTWHIFHSLSGYTILSWLKKHNDWSGNYFVSLSN